ncbi:MAG: hypothetical protein HC852_19865 [Acaryochloridaceae cyanobacterium RU_4_10]|nr:hypothetical protein [Acaryochloridaceae cyanobacterium RU_4_10]
MKARLNSASLCVTITLLSALVGGCNPLGGDNTSNTNVQPSPQPVASPAFPKPMVPDGVKSPAKIALTRPTNPDDRLRVIKSGRNDPFLKLADAKGTDGKDDKSKNEAKPKEKLTPQEQYLKHATSSYDRFLDKVSEAYIKPDKTKGAGSSSSIASSGGTSSGGINLPSLPSKPDLAGVKVTGVVEIAGMPRAIVEAPDEKTSRTVGIGDSLSGGKLYVKSIDLSNRAEPMVIFQQGDTQFSVAVGREPVLMASAATGSGRPLRPVRGLYSTQTR